MVGDSPMLEVSKPVQAVNISGELQRALPMSSRKDFTDFLEVTPGVTARTFDQGSGGQVYMLRGSEIENHVVQVDGADMGSFRQGWAGLYTGLSSDAIDDTQVKTGGVDASAPLGVGVVINVATPSGTNQFKGAASTSYQAKGWSGNNAAAGGRSAYSKIFQPDLSARRTHIVKTKLFFFGSFRYADREIGLSRTPAQLAGLASDPQFTAFANGGKSEYYYVKVTAQLSQNHQVYAFYQRDFNPELSAFPTESRPFNVTAFGGNGIGARLSSVWGSNVTTKVLAAYNDKSINGTFCGVRGLHLRRAGAGHLQLVVHLSRSSNRSGHPGDDEQQSAPRRRPRRSRRRPISRTSNRAGSVPTNSRPGCLRNRVCPTRPDAVLPTAATRRPRIWRCSTPTIRPVEPWCSAAGCTTGRTIVYGSRLATGLRVLPAGLVEAVVEVDDQRRTPCRQDHRRGPGLRSGSPEQLGDRPAVRRDVRC